ncbi:MAG TPA: transposase [Acidobacteriaceae bacterium]|jgi:putative transposase|nr:transposase [Acidobacteriaceae bacterium]
MPRPKPGRRAIHAGPNQGGRAIHAALRPTPNFGDLPLPGQFAYLSGVRSALPTWFVTIVTADRRHLLQSNRNASLLRQTLFHYRDEGRFRLHPYVIMPDHLHLLLTPSANQSLERCVQCIKGGFSHTMRAQTGYPGSIWQRGFHDHRIRDAVDYRHHCDYIAQNPADSEFEFLEWEGPGLDVSPPNLSL